MAHIPSADVEGRLRAAFLMPGPQLARMRRLAASPSTHAGVLACAAALAYAEAVRDGNVSGEAEAIAVFDGCVPWSSVLEPDDCELHPST